MKRRGLIALLVSIGLVLALLLSGCTPTAEPEVVEKIVTETVTVEVEKEYKFLNPRGIELPVEISGLAPRLDTLDGKTIWINQGEADPIIMPALWEIVQERYPNTDWRYIETSGFGPPRPEDEVVEEADAVVRGISW